MAATTKDLAWQKSPTAKLINYTVVDADIIYDGTMVTVDGSGEAHPGRDTVGDRFAGIATAHVDNTDDGETIDVDASRDRLFWAVAGSGFTAVVGDIGERAYVGDDQTVVSEVNSTNHIYAGRIVDFDNANTRVLIQSAVGATPVVTTICIPVQLSTIADGDIVTTYTPGFAGHVMKFDFITTTVASTAAKLSTLNLEIGTTDLTGGTIALTTAACDTLGKVVAGAAITAGAQFDADDTISVEASSTTAFVEGAGVLIITIAVDQ